MKKKDVALIIVVAVFAAIFSLLISRVLFTSGEQRQLKAEIVQPITTEFQQPDSTVFNERAINPTKLIRIGDTNNPKPF